MNNSYQAKNGFKTFLLTLVVSLGVFGVVYYITSYPVYELDIDSATEGTTENKATDKNMGVLGDKDTSPFGSLNEESPSVSQRVVLAGADELDALDSPADTETPETAPTVPSTTQSTVPDTGIAGMTISLFISLLILSAGIYYICLGPRKLALKTFEDNLLE